MRTPPRATAESRKDAPLTPNGTLREIPYRIPPSDEPTTRTPEVAACRCPHCVWQALGRNDIRECRGSGDGNGTSTPKTMAACGWLPPISTVTGRPEIALCEVALDVGRTYGRLALLRPGADVENPWHAEVLHDRLLDTRCRWPISMVTVDRLMADCRARDARISMWESRNREQALPGASGQRSATAGG